MSDPAPWTFEHDSGDRWLIRNETGGMAVNVEFAAIGKIAVNRQANWTRVVAAIADREAVPIKFRNVAFGAMRSPPYLAITWSSPSDSGDRRTAAVPFP